MVSRWSCKQAEAFCMKIGVGPLGGIPAKTPMRASTNEHEAIGMPRFC